MYNVIAVVDQVLIHELMQVRSLAAPAVSIPIRTRYGAGARFRGFSGACKALSNARREDAAALQIEILGQAVATEIDPELLEPLS
jgi:hypothetical protein